MWIKKKFDEKIFLSQKILWAKTILNPKEFWEQNKFLLQKFVLQQKKFWHFFLVQTNILVQKIFGSEKNFGPKKNFGQKKHFGQKNCLPPKKFCFKNIPKNNFGQKKIFFGLKKIIYPKKEFWS